MDGLAADESGLKKGIYDQISPWLETKIAQKADDLLNALRMATYSEPMEWDCDRIHVANGTLFVDGRFVPEKTYCNNRLPVNYYPDAPPSEKWLQFLAEPLYPEDIPTLQEYQGYCLLPTTRGQKMLMLIGKGGESKSRIGLVTRSIFGDSMSTTSIQKVEQNWFSRTALESKLLMVDDDIDMSALGKWLVGVSGGFEDDDLEPCGHTFSEMKPYHASNAQSDCTEMVKKIIAYWQSQT